MPNNIIMADAKGGEPYEIARKILDRTITEYIDPELTALGNSAFRNASNLVSLQIHGVTSLGASCLENTKVVSLAFPNMASWAVGIGIIATLKTLDLGENIGAIGSYALPFANLENLILRKASAVVGTSATSMNQTPMKSGGSGCTVYIPKVLYDHLGDGTSLDYKANSTWATYDGYGTITWKQIEGSIYETQYADGTPIPTGG
jgi:hypothetical protein